MRFLALQYARPSLDSLSRRSPIRVGFSCRCVQPAAAILAFLIAHGAACCNHRTFAAGKVDLKTIREAIDAYKSRVRTLAGEYRLTLTPEPDIASQLGSGYMRDLQYETRFLADIANNRTRQESLQSFHYLGKQKERLDIAVNKTWSFDGDRGYFLAHTHSKSPVEIKAGVDVPHQLNIAPTEDIGSDYVPWTFAGLRFIGPFSSLAALVHSPDAKLDGTEAIDGALCHRVTAGEGGHCVVWLDPAHDFLPRRMDVGETPANRKASKNPLRLQLLSMEFRGFPDQSHKGEVWFPVKSKAFSFAKMINEIEVRDLRVNVPLEKRQFQVVAGELAAGIQVTDSSVNPRRVTYTGDRKDLWDERKQLVNDESHEIESLIPDEPSPLFHPDAPRQPLEQGGQAGVGSRIGSTLLDSGNWLPWTVGIISLLLLVYGAVRLKQRPGS